MFKYISGTNEDDAKVEMTAPVRVMLEAGEGPFCKDHFKVSFFVPLDLQVCSAVPLKPIEPISTVI